ncbi:bifunctional phosphatase PAP2/diacylglycerol kinase family protein [Labedella endophytica]|uniref:Phosphatase PAP2 family protein n=1 Tax=Labedella endophytica TaxID=1523160 RepID=A0A433JS90_9MICO|nr:bifunctional phosphatase PAP2/diacylglycerol kinase family protein [Labedella endophytica]RUR00907.1 phosphatase PAP2 family protein [Labedella endophytica]
MKRVPSRLRAPVVSFERWRRLPRWVRRVDAAAGRRINRRAVHPIADVGLSRLTRVADRGVLWFALAAVLAVVGSRRAALRGIGSLTAASMLANLVGKRVFGGDRPLLKDIPVGRRLPAQPSSASFPSGHSASAAAFATGVALDSPRAGLVVAPLAAGVAYSRLHVGAHWLSDVIGGTALGVGVALLGRLLLPVRPKEERGGPVESIRVDLPASPTGEGVVIFLNPGSGKSVVRADPERIIRRRLPDADMRVLSGDDDLAGLVDEVATGSTPPLAIGVCGGDGTVATVANRARAHGIPLLGLPGGTFNHFVRATGLESIDDAIDAVQAGSGVRADVAEVSFDGAEPVTVMNAGSVGIYPDLVVEREKLEKRLGKWAAGVVATWRVLRHAEPHEVVVDGKTMRVWSVFVGVDPNFSHTVAPMRRLRLEGGELDVRVLHAKSRIHAVGSLAFGRTTSAILRALRLVPLSEASTMFTTDEVELRVSSSRSRPAPFGRDGEAEADLARNDYTARLRIVPGGLTVYARQR